MRTVRLFPLPSVSERVSAPAVVELIPPPPRELPKAEPSRQRAPVTTTTPSVPPLVAPIAPQTIPTTIAAPIAAPVAPVAHRDSVAGGSADTPLNRRPLTEIVPRATPVFPNAHTVTAPAAMAPAGVTAHNAPLSVAQRDSIMTLKMQMTDKLALQSLHRPQTDAEKRELALGQEPGRALPNSRAAPFGRVAPLMSGHAAVATPIASVSIPLPLFYPGPSPEQRRRDAAVAAEDWFRLRRLQDRITVRRDSIRADSLRRDSLEKARIRP